MVLTLTAERIYRSKQSERFRVTITGTSYKIIVQTNRPAVESTKGNKTIQWHLVEGNTEDKTKLEQVYKHLEKSLLKQPSSFQGTLNFIDRF